MNKEQFCQRWREEYIEYILETYRNSKPYQIKEFISFLKIGGEDGEFPRGTSDAIFYQCLINEKDHLPSKYRKLWDKSSKETIESLQFYIQNVYDEYQKSRTDFLSEAFNGFTRFCFYVVVGIAAFGHLFLGWY